MRDCYVDDLELSNIEKQNVQLQKKTAEENDELRNSILQIKNPNALRVSRGIRSLGKEAVRQILNKVKAYTKFTKGDDPYEKHDFGYFMYKSKKIFWTIVYTGGYNGYNNLVLTVLLADEW